MYIFRKVKKTIIIKLCHDFFDNDKRYTFTFQMEHNDDILKLKDMIQIESTKQLEMKEEHSKILLELKENNRSQIQEVGLSNIDSFDYIVLVIIL